MNKLITLLLGIISLTMISSCAKDEENLSGTISGIVTEYTSSNTPIAGATVTVNGKGLSKTTGSDGRFEFTGLEPGTYTIVVKANNYQANTKQVTVYAGQKANCDIQLEIEKVSVDISPANLVFDKTVDMLSFTITNQSNRDLTYNIASYMQELEVSPLLGSVKAKGQQAISVKVTNRSSVKKTTSGQIIVTVGSDSYQVNITINGTEEDKISGNVMGTISDYANANAPIAGATVTLSSMGQSKTTGSDGRYEFTDLTPGTYTITVSANEYEGSQKDVTIEAGKNVTCDFQLQKGAANVEVTPQNLTYASDVEQLSFAIKNSTSNTQQYTVSNIPEFATVSSSTGMISSKGSEAITVTVLNRKQIKEKKNAQIKVTVGDNAFVVNISVEPYQEESVSIDISPSSLNFDKSTSQLTFVLTSKNSRALEYDITSDLSFLDVNPTKGTLKEKGLSTITVSIPERQKIDIDRVGKLTIEIEGNSFAVPVSVAKYETDISVSPENLSFDSDTEKLSFFISNGENSAVDYSISNNRDDILTISSTSGSVNGNGKVDITVTVKDRKSITSDQSGQINVTIGGKSFYVYVSVSKFNVNASINPQALTFDKNTEKLTFTITNNNNVAWDYSVSSDLNILTLSPPSGTISAKGNATVTVNVNNRSSITEEKNGGLTVYLNGTNYGQVNVKVDKYDSGSTPSGDVTRGLQAYYSFDDGTAKDSRNGYNGIYNGGKLITDTPNGKGKALFLKKGENVSIPYAPLDGKKNHSVSLWVKDFGAGCLFICYDHYLFAPSLIVTEEMKLRAYTGSSDYGHYKNFSTNLSNYQSDKWTMFTVVTTTEGSNSQGTCKFYINGQRIDTGTSYTNRNSGAISMSIGGNFGSFMSDPMKIDNVRLYSVSLTDDEVLSIYNSEK